MKKLVLLFLSLLLVGCKSELLKRLEVFRENCKKKGEDPNEHIGYYITHEYRAKNSFGVKVTHTDRIYFDKALKQIINVERVK